MTIKTSGMTVLYKGYAATNNQAAAKSIRWMAANPGTYTLDELYTIPNAMHSNDIRKYLFAMEKVGIVELETKHKYRQIFAVTLTDVGRDYAAALADNDEYTFKHNAKKGLKDWFEMMDWWHDRTDSVGDHRNFYIRRGAVAMLWMHNEIPNFQADYIRPLQKKRKGIISSVMNEFAEMLPEDPDTFLDWLKDEPTEGPNDGRPWTSITKRGDGDSSRYPLDVIFMEEWPDDAKAAMVTYRMFVKGK